MAKNFEDYFNSTFGSDGVTFKKSVTFAGGLVNQGTSVGSKSNIISGSGATATLTAAQSGSAVLFDRAAGIVYTLPAPAVGLSFRFITTVTITGGAAEVDTDAGTTFLLGAVSMGSSNQTPSATLGPKFFLADGAATVKISSNGTTTGGVKGSEYTMVCVSATVWQVSGIVIGSAGATVATPFA